MSVQKDIKVDRQIWRDESKHETWVDGEFFDDKQLVFQQGNKYPRPYLGPKLKDLCKRLNNVATAIKSVTPTTQEASKAMVNLCQVFHFTSEDLKPKIIDPRATYKPTVAKPIYRTDSGTVVNGRFFDDVEASRNGIEIFQVDHLWEYRNFDLPLDCPMGYVPQPFFKYDENATYAKRRIRRVESVFLKAFAPLGSYNPEFYANEVLIHLERSIDKVYKVPCQRCGVWKSENEECRGLCGQKVFDPPLVSTRNSYIGWAFYWGGQTCSRLLRNAVLPGTISSTVFPNRLSIVTN